MRTIPPTATQDDYSDACTLVEIGAQHVSYKVANQPVVAQFMPVNPHGGEDEWMPPGGLLITQETNSFGNACGVRFKSALAGTPATVLAQTFAPGDPTPAGGIAFLATLNAEGQSSSIVIQELDYAEIKSGSPAVSATTEATATVVIPGNAVGYDGTAVIVEFYTPKLIVANPGSEVATLVFLVDSTVIGQHQLLSNAPNANTGQPAVTAKRRYTPTAGTHVFKAAMFVSSAASSVTVQAGDGGPGNLAPAFLRVTRI